MDSLLRLISENESWLLLALSVAVVYLFIGYRILARKAAAEREKWQQLLEGVRGDDLERLLELHFKERAAMNAELQDAIERIKALERISDSAKRFIGVVRFDAFEDVSGHQSFALAIYDDRGNGVIVSSLVGRDECRVYCKPLHAGKSDRELSEEERRAIEEATGSGPRQIVSR